MKGVRNPTTYYSFMLHLDKGNLNKTELHIIVRTTLVVFKMHFRPF